MSVRTRQNKLRKTKLWKTTLPNYYTVVDTQSRAGVSYTKRVRTDKIESGTDLSGYGFLTYLRSLPFIGGLFS